MKRDMSFFKNVYQVEGLFGDEPAKLPVFYYDGNALTGIFLAKMSALKKFMPKRGYYPAPVFPGIGAIAITCFEYKDTDIRPYNEISFSIPMTYKSRCILPSASLISDLRKNQFNVYVQRLPVTTEVARAGGVTVYNYPKFLSKIDFEHKGDDLIVTLAEKDELIFRVTAKKIQAGNKRAYRYITYPVKDDCAQTAEVLVNAKKFGQSIKPGSVKIELGKTHKMALELEGALIGHSSILHQYMPEFQAILYAPCRLE